MSEGHDGTVLWMLLCGVAAGLVTPILAVLKLAGVLLLGWRWVLAPAAPFVIVLVAYLVIDLSYAWGGRRLKTVDTAGQGDASLSQT